MSMNNKEAHDFYRSYKWQKKREEILKRDHFECQDCKKNGKYTRATDIHHIKNLVDHEDLALDDNNLISLCESCHNKRHVKESKPKEIELRMPEKW